MNTRQIQPKPIFTQDGEKNATILALTNFFDYHFDDGSGKVNYQLLGMESPGIQIDELGNEHSLPEVAVLYFTGTIEIPSNIVQQWGTSDEIIWNYIITNLNL
jgi:hypothetical protein